VRLASCYTKEFPRSHAKPPPPASCSHSPLYEMTDGAGECFIDAVRYIMILRVSGEVLGVSGEASGVAERCIMISRVSGECVGVAECIR
jgi:hypothetical protein